MKEMSESGDTIVFVDLGYTGTTQLKLQKIFKKEYKINIYGLYLISFAMPAWRRNRSGLIDASWCDNRLMHMLVSYIALLEQLCTSNEFSVIDYEKNGKPIFNETHLGNQQHSKLVNIQKNCLNFIKDAAGFF